MSLDEEARALERLRREHPSDVQALAKHLQARLRSGQLLPSRLRLAAAFGSEAACLALGQPWDDPLMCDDRRDDMFWPKLAELLRRVCLDEREAGVRVAIISARRVLPMWLDRFPETPEPAAAVEAAEAWLRSQSPEDARRAVEVGFRSELDVSDATLYLPNLVDHAAAGMSASYCALSCSQDPHDFDEREAQGAPITNWVEAVEWAGVAAADALGSSSALFGEIAPRVVEWELGE